MLASTGLVTVIAEILVDGGLHDNRHSGRSRMRPVVLLVMAPLSQKLEPPANPGRFSHKGEQVTKD